MDKAGLPMPDCQVWPECHFDVHSKHWRRKKRRQLLDVDNETRRSVQNIRVCLSAYMNGFFQKVWEDHFAWKMRHDSKIELLVYVMPYVRLLLRTIFSCFSFLILCTNAWRERWTHLYFLSPFFSFHHLTMLTGLINISFLEQLLQNIRFMWRKRLMKNTVVLVE